MKKLFSMLIMLTIVLTLSAQEQKKEVVIKREGMMKANPAHLAPAFTQEQHKQMAEFKLNLQKEMLQIDNQINEKKAQLKSLEQAEKANMKSVFAKIDEITALHNQKMKAMSTHKNNVRSILTEEQRIKFDMMGQGKPGNQGNCCKMEKGKKMEKEHQMMMQGKGRMMMEKEGQMIHRQQMGNKEKQMMHKEGNTNENKETVIIEKKAVKN